MVYVSVTATQPSDRQPIVRYQLDMDTQSLASTRHGHAILGLNDIKSLCNLVTGHTAVIIGVVYRCPNKTKQNNEKIHNAINDVSKGDCIIMGDFNHGNIKWDTLQSTGVEDSTFLCLVQDNFLTQHVLEPTRAARVLDIVLSSQKEFVDNLEIQEPLGSSDHNQLHFNINIKSGKTKVKQCRGDFRKGNYKKIRKSLAHIDWDEKMKNKTATECWDIL